MFHRVACARSLWLASRGALLDDVYVVPVVRSYSRWLRSDHRVHFDLLCNVALAWHSGLDKWWFDCRATMTKFIHIWMHTLPHRTNRSVLLTKKLVCMTSLNIVTGQGFVHTLEHSRNTVCAERVSVGPSFKLAVYDR